MPPMAKLDERALAKMKVLCSVSIVVQTLGEDSISKSVMVYFLFSTILIARTQLITRSLGLFGCTQVKELQAKLKKYKLDTTGVKAVLLQRLQDHLSGAFPTGKHQVDGGKGEHEHAEDVGETVMEDAASSDDAPRDPEHAEANSVKIDAGTISTLANTATHSDDASPTPSPQSKHPQPDQADRDVDRKLAEEDVGDQSSRPQHDANPSKQEPSEPSRDAATETLRIDNFRRPFTLNAVKALVQQAGDFVENGFWMDAIKTHCYVTYATKDAAIKMRESLDEVKWPPESGIALSAAFSEVTAMEIMANGGDRRPNLKRKASSELQKATARTPVSIDAFFLKTETKPVLYYLPLTDEQVRQRKAQQKSGDVNGAARREKGSANLPATRKNRNKNARSNYRRVQRHGSK